MQPANKLGERAGVEPRPSVVLGRRDLDKAGEEQQSGSRRHEGRGTRIGQGTAPGRQPGRRQPGGRAGRRWVVSRCGGSRDKSTGDRVSVH
jgi:hypothetical protein